MIAGRSWASATAASRTGGDLSQRMGYVHKSRSPETWLDPGRHPEADARIALIRSRVDRPSFARIIEVISASHSSSSDPIGADRA
jgi:hypothetical protein